METKFNIFSIIFSLLAIIFSMIALVVMPPFFYRVVIQITLIYIHFLHFLIYIFVDSCIDLARRKE